MKIKPNSPLPLGPQREGTAVHFRIASAHARVVILGIFLNPEDHTPTYEIPFDEVLHKTGSVWHLCVEDLPKGFAYGYYIPNKHKNHHHAEPIWLLDPYAPLVVSPHTWCNKRPFMGYRPLSAIDSAFTFDWEDDRPLRIPIERTLIYEMHVRGFTEDASSQVQHPGTFLGVIEKIPHLKALGITAVELLPIMEWDEAEYHACSLEKRKLLCNYWGYSTVHFLSPMGRFAFGAELGSSLYEFKQMVKALHAAGIEVILDIVWNHTAEGGKRGPTYSFKGLDRSIYYLVDYAGHMLDYTGCGNTMQTNHPWMVEYILHCLRYWVLECHVDGFRFDLASIFHRGREGRYLDPAPVIEAISHDPVLSNTKLIAESWDAAGLYQVGGFYKAQALRWTEWNGQYRDNVRNFIKGSDNSAGLFATRICGSKDLYGEQGSALNSVNFITAHDGFTLRDLVSYEKKHNRANGEGNRDGSDHNESWNCGVEGQTEDLSIIKLRGRQMRNFIVALLVSQGIPMLHMGDEYGHTKFGNNNTWCQDNALSHFLWDELRQEPALFRFTCLMIKLRKQYARLFPGRFLEDKDIIWHGQKPKEVNWNADSRFIAFQLIDTRLHNDLLVSFNAGHELQIWHLPSPPKGHAWHLFVNTSALYPEEIHPLDKLTVMEEESIHMDAYSSCVLLARKV